MNKEKPRFYLFAGMGGRAQQRKRRIFLGWAIATGLFVSAIVASLLYFLSDKR